MFMYVCTFVYFFLFFTIWFFDVSRYAAAYESATEIGLIGFKWTGR